MNTSSAEQLSQNRNKKRRRLRVFNIAITMAMVGITTYGSMQNGWFTLANLVSWLGLIGTVGLAYAKPWNFKYNMVQNIFAALQAGKSKLYGDMIISLFYFGSQIYGKKNWKKHTFNGKLAIEKQSNWKLITFAIVFGGFILGGVSWLLGGAYIFLDAFNNATAMIAQVLQMNRQRSSWILWVITNVIGVAIWTGVGEPQMGIMYTVFALNSVRGYLNWSSN